MPDIPAPYTQLPLPLETEEAPCGRCGGASRRHAMDHRPCEVCVALLDEIARCYQGQRLEKGDGDV